MPLAIQRPLPCLAVEAARALVSLDVVKTELVDYNEDQILTFYRAATNGRPMLGPGWNIARRLEGRGERGPGTGKADVRAERRVLMACVRDFKQGRLPERLERDDWLKLILPHQKPFLTGPQLERALNCGSTHICNLVRDLTLELVPGTGYRPGRGGSPLITRASVVKFLTERQEI